MATNHTANYGLSQWLRTDKVQMEDFNADNAKIDGALAGQAASAAAMLSDLTNKINGVSSDMTNKINGVSSDLTSKINGVSSDLTNKINGVSASQTSAVTALTAELAKKGNCQIEVRTITDSTAYTNGVPFRLQFSDKPMFFVFSDGTIIGFGTYGLTYAPTLFTHPQYGAGLGCHSGSWSGNTLTITNFNRTFFNSKYYLIAFYAQ